MAKAWTSEAHEKADWHAHQVLAGVGYTSQSGVMSLYSMKAKTLHHLLGDASYHLKKVAGEVEKWEAPEKSRGKPLGIWGIPVLIFQSRHRNTPHQSFKRRAAFSYIHFGLTVSFKGSSSVSWMICFKGRPSVIHELAKSILS